MPLDLQRLVGPIQVKGTADDPLFVVVQKPSASFDTDAIVTNVPISTKTTILTQAFVSTSFERIALIAVSGDVYAKYFFTVNNNDVDIRRSGPDRNLIFDFSSAPYVLSTGDVVDVKVEHYVTGLYNFNATIYGYA